MSSTRTDHRVVLVASAACALRDELVAKLRGAGATVLVADARASASRLIAMFRCDVVVCIVGAPTEGIRSLPAAHPGPRYVAIDACGGPHALEGFDAVVPLGVASSACASRRRVVELVGA